MSENIIQGKVILSASLLTLSGSIFATHSSNQLYPAVGVGILTVAIFLFLPVIFNKIRNTKFYLGILVVFGVTYRTYIYMFPASLIGWDPTSYARWTQSIIEGQSIADAVTSGVYVDSPLSIILPAVVGIISDVSGPTVLGIYPVIIGLLVPITTVTLVRQTEIDNVHQVAIAAAILATVGKVSITLSYQPIAQTLGVSIWLVLIITISAYINHLDKRFLIVIGFLFTPLLFTHRLPPIYVISSMIFFIFLFRNQKLNRYLYMDSITFHHPFLKNILILTTAFVISLYFLFITQELATSLVFRLVNYLNPGTRSQTALYQAADSYTFATAVQNQLHDIFFRRAHGLVFLPLSGVAWVLITRIREQKTILLIMSVTAVTAVFMLLGLVNPAIGGILRQLFVGEPILAVLAAVGYIYVFQSIGNATTQERIKKLGYTCLIIIIVVQVISVTATLPDQSGTSRKYLSQEEVAGTEFVCEFATGSVSTDRYYATTPPNSFIEGGKALCLTRFENIQFLFTANISSLNSENILIRSEREYTTSNGIYRINWDPQERLSIRFSKVYTNSDVKMFRNG